MVPRPWQEAHEDHVLSDTLSGVFLPDPLHPSHGTRPKPLQGVHLSFFMCVLREIGWARIDSYSVSEALALPPVLLLPNRAPVG